MTEALRKYLMPVFAPDDGTGGGADGDVIDKPDAAAEAAAAKVAEDAAKAAEAAGTGGKTALEAGAAADDGDKAAVAPWGDDWREKMAGGDDALLKVLKRYTTPIGTAKALVAAQRTISEGKLGKVPDKPTDGKDEKAMAEWRKAAGIPADPTGYKLPEPVAKALTDADKPVLASFTEFAHAHDARPDVVDIASEWYVEHVRQMEEAQTEQDKGHKEEAEDSMRLEWGGEFKANMNLAKRFLDESPIGAMGWAGLRDDAGRMLGSNPEFMNWAAEMGRHKFGDAVFASSDAAAKHDNRRAEIEKIRDTDFDRYEREGLDKEMRTIIEKDLARKK